jgi:tetratricopeptide (TPR) repeat protein
MNSRKTFSELLPGADRRYAIVFVYVMLAALTWSVFGQTIGHDFVAYDDQNYVYNNDEIAAGITARGIVAAFTEPHARNWHPMTTISHMLDCQIFGLDPAGHHLVNVLLHTATVLLLFSVLHGMTGALWRSAFVAAVFAVHPLRAESVAWIAERKDVLSGVFFMLTIAAYVYYVRRPSLKRYLCVALIFSFGLMSKPMLVTLPLLLLLLDYWPLNRFKGEPSISPKSLAIAALEKLPLLFLSAMSGATTLIVQRATIDYSNQVSFLARLSNAVVSYIIYAGQLIWPAKLVVLYPYTSNYVSGFSVAISFISIVAITILAIALRRQLPYLSTGWCWYLISLLPVIGLIQVGLQSHADRYTYLPQIGLVISLTWIGTDLLRAITKRRELLVASASLIVALLAWRGWIQTSTWKNTESLWHHVLAVAPANEVAHYNIAEELRSRNQLNGAIIHYQAALKSSQNAPTTHCQLNPAIIHNGLGNAFAQKSLYTDAMTQYRMAIMLQPDFADAHSNLAAMLVRAGELTQATAEYEIALGIPPEDAICHVRLGNLLLATGNDHLAIAHYRRAVEIDPNSVAVRNALAWALATQPPL